MPLNSFRFLSPSTLTRWNCTLDECIRGSNRCTTQQSTTQVQLPPLFSYFLKFVAQPNCQQLLASRWYDEFPGWRRRHWAGKFFTCVFIGLLYPAFALCYLIAPKSRSGLFIRKPFIKFICHTASYLTFLFLLLLASQHIVTTEQDRQGPAPTTVEWMILPWVLGEYKLGLRTLR